MDETLESNRGIKMDNDTREMYVDMIYDLMLDFKRDKIGPNEATIRLEQIVDEIYEHEDEDSFYIGDGGN